MIKQLATILFMFVMLNCVAQNKQLLYGFEEVPQSLLQNPGAKVPQNKHYGIPFLSQIHLNVGSSGVTVFDIFGETNENINSRIRNKILELKNTDFFTATEQWTILDFGWKAQNDIYWSAGVYQELDFIAYFPRDLAILAWDGNKDYIGREFDLSELSTTADVLSVFHVGANKKINDKLTIGGRFKIYNSILNIRSVANEGVFVTERVEGSNNIYQNNFKNVDVAVHTSGYIAYRDLEGSAVNETFKRALLGGNLGVGIDFGATYDLTDRISVSASVLDFGAIFQSKDVQNYTAKGTYTLDGIELLFPSLADGQSTIDYYGNLEDEIKKGIVRDTTSTSYSYLRPVKLNGSAQYNFGQPGTNGPCDCLNMGSQRKTNQSLGVQVFTVFRPRQPQMAVTAFYYRKLFKFLAAKTTLTADAYSYTNLGVAAAVDIGKVNFYIAADNLLKYGNIAKANSLSLQLGFNIKFEDQ